MRSPEHRSAILQRSSAALDGSARWQRKTETPRRDAGLAILASLLLNALAARALLSPPYIPPVVAQEALLVVDFEPVARTADVGPEAPGAASTRSRIVPEQVRDNPPALATAQPNTREQMARRAPATPASPPAPVEGALTAVLLQQVRNWSNRHPVEIQKDPFSSHTPRLPGKVAKTFRMREPPSPARVVARIGVLFGADGRTGCTGIENRIAGYAAAGNREELQEAVDYEKRLCRP